MALEVIVWVKIGDFSVTSWCQSIATIEHLIIALQKVDDIQQTTQLLVAEASQSFGGQLHFVFCKGQLRVSFTNKPASADAENSRKW